MLTQATPSTPHPPPKASNKGILWEHSCSKKPAISITLTKRAEGMVHTCLQTKAQPTGGTPVTSEAAEFNHDISAGLDPASHPSPAAGGGSHRNRPCTAAIEIVRLSGITV